MNERIVDIVAWIVSQLKVEKISNIKADKLSEKGFTEQEISTAFSWMYEKLESKKPTEVLMSQIFPKKSFRLFQEFEKDFFTEEAYAIIIQFLSIGLISNEHIELMIERAEEFGTRKIDTNMIKQFVAIFMFDIPPNTYTGSRFSLTEKDNVN
jgi:uncharacterized protein Smg (DUF494 family)